MLPRLLTAQQVAGPVVTGNFEHVAFRQFVEALEKQVPSLRFYFDPQATDSVFVTVQARNMPLQQVLTQALQKSKLHFALDQQNRVFVTPAALQLTLPEAFFLPEGTVAATDAQEQTTLDEDKGGRYLSKSEVKLYQIGSGKTTGTATLAGRMRESKSGEPVIGANVFIESPSIGTSTDAYGYFSLTLPVGRHELKIKGIGIKSTRRQILLRGDGQLNIDTEEDIIPLREVVVEAERDRNVSSLRMGVEKLDVKTIRQVPTAFGEADVLRVILTLPGVKSVGEGSTGLNVRGGATDQNLILLNDAMVYSPSHLFGFFSAFNPDVLKSVELYKSAIPAKYGGRLSSVLDIVTRDGNKKKFSGSGGIGPLTSRLTLEGPILKDRSSFLVGGRSSYSDWILGLLPVKSFRESSASFYDFNAHLTHEFNANNSLYVSGYVSHDRFQLASDTVYRYKNRNGSLKWRHSYSNRLSSVATATYSHYDYNIGSSRDEASASQLAYGIDQYGAQLDFSFLVNAKHNLEFGASTLRYQVMPGRRTPTSSQSLVIPVILPQEQGQESAVYLSDRIEFTPRFAVDLGLRYSFYHSLGPHDVYRYAPGLEKTEDSILDTLKVGRNKVIATYHGPEYRASARYSLTENSSLKASYNRTRQYIHMLSNTASMSPTDIWKLSDYNVRPQIGNQVSLGYYRNVRNSRVETSVEAYYKATHDFVDYKGGATLVLNPHIETDIVNAEGRSYGLEFMVRKLAGKVNGWVSYTYSRSLVRVNLGTPAERINGGKWYPSNFDKPHDFTLVGNYRFSRRFSTSLNMTYSTGRPITLPLAKYYVAGAVRVFYSDRNAYRVPDYFRTDLALNFEGNHKVKKVAHGSWTLGVYNLTGRRNPYSVYYKSVGGQIKGYQLSIFGQPIPTLTYNFRF